MALQLILDAAIPVLAEPGFWDFLSTRRLWEKGFPADDAAHQGLWADEPTRTLMLRPLQLESSWLNTAAALPSILRLYQPGSGAGDIVVNPLDVSSQSIFEAPIKGNPDNPYIYHVPVGPAGSFPGAREDVPGSPPALLGVPSPTDLTIVPLKTQGPTIAYQPSATMPPASTPPPVIPIGSTADGKFIGHSKSRLDANANLFFRWHHPTSQLGFPCIYEFFIGQFRLRVKDVTIEIFKDISPGGDRTAWKKEMVFPAFTVADFSPPGTGNINAGVRPQESLAHDRNLLWIPFRRNQVLLYSSSGKWAILTVNGGAKLLADGSDWDIVRSDNVLVWVMTPAAGRFQIQRIAYPAGPCSLQSPPVTIDYTPSVSPTVLVTADLTHGSSVGTAQSQPPSYTIPENSANDCPKPATIMSADQRRQYGVVLTLSPNLTQEWTPFVYGYQITTPRVFQSNPTTPTTVGDVNPGSALNHVTITAGLTPGEGRMVAEVIDETPFALASYYYRCSLPIQLYDTVSAKPWFTGITMPIEVTPLVETGAPRRLTFPAADRWKALADTYLRDQRDWSGFKPGDSPYFGHIDVVKFVCEQGGVDCSAAEFPAGYVANTYSTLNSPLGGQTSTGVHQKTQDLEQGWRPLDRDTAASFIKRIQDLYSGWYAGFRLDGTFFYLPREYFTTPAVTFNSHSDSVNNPTHLPTYRNPVTFTTVEPEANVIVIKCGDAKTGSIQYSSPWIDWASILNPAAVNYIGRWRAEIVEVGGTFSCPQLNWIGRTVWNQTRRRRREARFEATWVPSLKIGQAFTLGGYGNYRLIGMHARLEKGAYHVASYTGEYIENGF